MVEFVTEVHVGQFPCPVLFQRANENLDGLDTRDSRGARRKLGPRNTRRATADLFHYTTYPDSCQLLIQP